MSELDLDAILARLTDAQKNCFASDKESQEKLIVVLDDMRDLIGEVQVLRGENGGLWKVYHMANAFQNCAWEFGEDAPSACGERLEHLTDAVDAIKHTAKADPEGKTITYDGGMVTAGPGVVIREVGPGKYAAVCEEDV